MRYIGWIGILLVIGLGGCDWVTASGPESVRVRLEGNVDAMEVITSKKFLVSRDPEDGWQASDVLDADTLRANLPFERTYDISEDQRFLVRVPNLRDGLDLRLRGWVDGEQRFDQSSASIPADSTLQFMYVFGRGGSADDGGLL